MQRISNTNEWKLTSRIRIVVLSIAIIALAWMFLAEQRPRSAKAFEQAGPAKTVSTHVESRETMIEQQMALEAERGSRLFEYRPDPMTKEFEPFSFGAIRPLFMGVDDVNIPAFLVDPSNASTAPAFTGFQVWGAAYDSANARVFFNNGSTLYVWPVGGTVSTLGTIVDGAGATQSMVSLAWYNGQLYGTKNIATEAVYKIDHNTRIATIHITYATTHDMGGLAIDPNNGNIYATDDGSTDSLVRINNDGSVTPIAPYPTGQTDIDGLAISNDGRAFLITDEPGSVYVYDLVGGAYLPPFPNPWTTSEVFSAGTWISSMAATGNISGRVVTQSGGGIPNVYIQITDGASYTAITRSSSFGYFIFEDVPTGATYTMTGTAKLYTFAPLNLPMTGDVTGLEMTANGP